MANYDIDYYNMPSSNYNKKWLYFKYFYFAINFNFSNFLEEISYSL